VVVSFAALVVASAIALNRATLATSKRKDKIFMVVVEIRKR
jgi:hypothetical protein